MGALLRNKGFFFFLLFHFGENSQKKKKKFPHFSDLAKVVVIIHKKKLNQI
jgi:hypothetical protein